MMLLSDHRSNVSISLSFMLRNPLANHNIIRVLTFDLSVKVT